MRTFIKLFVLFVLQAVTTGFFYRCRAISHFLWSDSDFVVFALPFLIGLAVAATIVFRSFTQASPAKRTATVLGLSITGAFLASFIGTVVAFNLYGT